MTSQDVGVTHDGRPGFRGSIVNVGSNLGLVGKSKTRENILYLEQAYMRADSWDSGI